MTLRPVWSQFCRCAAPMLVGVRVRLACKRFSLFRSLCQNCVCRHVGGAPQDWVTYTDWSLLNAAHDIGIKNPALRWCIPDLGPVVLRPLGLLAAMVALAKRKIRIALLLLACLPLNAIMTIAHKSAAHRPRRLRWHSAHSTSFPSGHVEATKYRALTVLLPYAHSRFTRHIAITARCACRRSVLWVALNVHHPTDVAAGCCRGTLYFPRACAYSTAVDIRAQRRVSCFIASGGV